MDSFAQLRICCASAGRLSNIVRCLKEKSLTDHLCLRNGLPPTCYKGFQRAVHDMNVSWAIVLVGVLLATVVANEPRKTLTLDSRKKNYTTQSHLLEAAAVFTEGVLTKLGVPAMAQDSASKLKSFGFSILPVSTNLETIPIINWKKNYDKFYD